MASSFYEDAEKSRRSLNGLPQPRVGPPLIVVSGLSGTGKSFLCRRLVEKLPFLILPSDALRKVLFPVPQYDEQENKRLFPACHALIKELLKNGIPVIFDATNPLEHHREYLYRAAAKAGAKVILVWVEAPPQVVRQRLLARERTVVPQCNSKAGWEVYSKMKSRTGKIPCNHLVVDTSQDITAAVDKIVRATGT